MSILCKYNYFLDDQDYHFSLEFSSFAISLSEDHCTKLFGFDFKKTDIVTKFIKNSFFDQEPVKFQIQHHRLQRTYSETNLNLQILAHPRALFKALRIMKKQALMNWFQALFLLKLKQKTNIQYTSWVIN